MPPTSSLRRRGERRPPPAPRAPRAGAAAFTLVELLVVIGVISVLVALLLPVLSRAREQAARTACLANLRSMAQAVTAYAVQNQGYFPPSVYPDGTWCYAFDLKNSSNPAAGAMGLGLLLTADVIKAEVGPQVMHCPSMDTLGGPYSGHCMDVAPGTNVWGAGVSWFKTTTANRIIYGYNYRSPSYSRTHTDPAGRPEPMKLSRVEPDMLLVVDQPDPRFGRVNTHREGYNYARADGSGDWYNDPKGLVDQMAGHSLPVDGIYNVHNDERIYEFIEAGKTELP